MSWLQYYDEDSRSLGSLTRNVFEHRALLELVADRSRIDGEPVLEVGTGTGEMSSFLAWYGCRVASVDRSFGLLVRASGRFRVNASVSCQDAFDLAFAPGSFSAAFSQGLLEHFPDEAIRALVAEQLRVARRVIFSVPSLWYPRRDFGDERLLTRSDWERILKPFRVTRSFYYGRSSRRLRHGFRRQPLHVCLSVAER